MCHLGNVFDVFFDTAYGFAGGAPGKTCIDGVPHHHGAQRQITPPPYRMELSQKSYKPHDVISSKKIEQSVEKVSIP